MTGKWIRTPAGRSIRHGPDRFKAMLAQRLAQQIPLPLGMPANTEPVAYPSAPYSTERFNSGTIIGAEVTMLGAGSVASHCAQPLGSAQLRINCIDDKDVRPEHTQGGRTIYDPSQIGLRKVDALRAKVERNSPGATIIPYPYKTSAMSDADLLAIFVRSLVVIVAMDDPEEILRVARLAYPVTNLVQVALHARAASGHIALTIPFVTPCLACTLDISSARQIRRLDHEAANSWDIITVAQLAARTVIDLLYSKVTGQPITRWDITKNLIYIANTREELSPDGPGLSYECSQRRPGCLVCHPLP